MTDLQITVDGADLSATWTETNQKTRRAIETQLPLSGDAMRWGDELYFRTPVDIDPEDTQTEVPVGAVAYWPQGNAICLFWGPTPASQADEPRAASPVAVVAQIDDTGPLSRIDGGATVRIEANESTGRQR
ncbi:MAG: cyclophilin-like family protein [Natronomonas sp.]